ncbi:MAG: cell division protein FtsL [Hyphomicrobium sp.]
MSILNALATCFMLISAFVLYSLNYDTRLIETQVRLLDRSANTSRSDIALLNAERAHLSRPERIEPLARKLGLEPLRANQILQVPLSKMMISSTQK